MGKPEPPKRAGAHAPSKGGTKPNAPRPEPGAPLPSDEVELWRRAMRDATPIARKATAPLPKPLPLGPRTLEPRASAPQAPAPNSIPRSDLPRPVPVGPPALAPGEARDMDKRTAERLRRGELEIDGRLDLHGHTVVEAHKALAAFIERAWRARQRCLLVITGKGRAPEGELGAEARVGVIKAGVPRWLNEPGLRGRILAISDARPQHGGSGALYVLLKRQR
ncbi:MAG TPA: Smr/MutS family protein [Alphaproteobacteria bacterium]|nr:Smr/MutS family protein [Alphaproteobacteria bacterium]